MPNDNALSNRTKAQNGGRSCSGTNGPCSIIGRSKVTHNTAEFGIGVDNRIRRLNLLNGHPKNKVSTWSMMSYKCVCNDQCFHYLESGVCVCGCIIFQKGTWNDHFLFSSQRRQSLRKWRRLTGWLELSLPTILHSPIVIRFDDWKYTFGFHDNYEKTYIHGLCLWIGDILRIMPHDVLHSVKKHLQVINYGNDEKWYLISMTIVTFIDIDLPTYYMHMTHLK